MACWRSGAGVGPARDGARRSAFAASGQRRADAPHAHRYQLQGERLLSDNLRLADELETSKLNLKDINEFLTNELKVCGLPRGGMA